MQLVCSKTREYKYAPGSLSCNNRRLLMLSKIYSCFGTTLITFLEWFLAWIFSKNSCEGTCGDTPPHQLDTPTRAGNCRRGGKKYWTKSLAIKKNTIRSSFQFPTLVLALGKMVIANPSAPIYRKIL